MIMNKINKLDFNKKEVVKTMLNIVKKDDLKNRVWMDFGFFDNPKDFQKFKKYLKKLKYRKGRCFPLR